MDALVVILAILLSYGAGTQDGRKMVDTEQFSGKYEFRYVCAMGETMAITFSEKNAPGFGTTLLISPKSVSFTETRISLDKTDPNLILFHAKTGNYEIAANAANPAESEVRLNKSNLLVPLRCSDRLPTAHDLVKKTQLTDAYPALKSIEPTERKAPAKARPMMIPAA